MTCSSVEENAVVAATACAVQSFGWADFPVTSSLEENPTATTSFAHQTDELVIKPTCSTDIASDATASTLDESDWFDDDSILSSETEDETEAASSLSSSLLQAHEAAAAKSRRRVVFDKVYVRQHNVIVGVHPLATGGYALELGWEYSDQATGSCSVDAYEEQKNRQNTSLRRLSPLERRYKLAEVSGDSMLQIAQQEKELRQQVSNENVESPPALLQSNSKSSMGLRRTQQVSRCTSFTELSALA
jgi:hypothetical protein